MDMNIRQTLKQQMHLERRQRSELHLVGKINHDISNIPQWLPLNVKVDIKLTLAPSNFMLRKVFATAPAATVSLISEILHAQIIIHVQSLCIATEFCCFGSGKAES